MQIVTLHNIWHRFRAMPHTLSRSLMSDMTESQQKPLFESPHMEAGDPDWRLDMVFY